MAKCVGCGLEVNNGILEVNTCASGGVACASAAHPAPGGCTDGLYLSFRNDAGNPVAGDPNNILGCGLTSDADGKIAVQLQSGGGLVCEDSGLKINVASPVFPPNPGTTPPAALGCGLNTDATGKLIVDIGDAATCGTIVRNDLKCDTATNGLTVNHQYSIAGNTGICGAKGTIERAYEFLLPPNSFNDIRTGATYPVGTYQWHTDTWKVGPNCTDPNQSWAGNTIWDMGGLNFDLAPNSLVRVSTQISQNYDGNPIAFQAPVPDQRMTFDTRGIGVRNQFDYQSHDTTWQIVSGGQTFLFQMRLTVVVVQGSCIITGYGGGLWEANWHYSHVTGPDSAGCIA